MTLTPVQTIIMILVIALGMVITRFTPFIVFPEGKPVPKVIVYLGHMLPPAMMGLLVVYCLKDVCFTAWPYGLPEIISIGCIVGLHLWKRNVLLSIGAGTVCYMLLIRLFAVIAV